MSRSLKTRTRRLERENAAKQSLHMGFVIRATDIADADRQVEALCASGALDGWEDTPFPIMRIMGLKAEESDAA